MSPSASQLFDLVRRRASQRGKCRAGVLLWGLLCLAINFACSPNSPDPNRHSPDTAPELLSHPSYQSQQRQLPSAIPVDPNAKETNGLSSIVLPSVEHPSTLVDRLAERVNANQDDWDTEQSTLLADNQLKLLAKLVMDDQLSDAKLNTILLPEFELSSVAEQPMASGFQDGMFRVQRLADSSPRFPTTVRGPDAFRQLVDSWRAEPPRDSALRLTFKLFRIEATPTGFSTRVYLEVAKAGAEQSHQRNLECECAWRVTSSNAQLNKFTVLNASQAEITRPGGKLFVDCTRTVMARNSSYIEQFVPGIPAWAQRIGRELMGQFGHHGLAIGDVNGDGLDDLYVCDTGGLPNRLYLQQEDGTVRDVSETSGVDLLEESLGALLVDLDNDGDPDLVVVSDPYLHIAENLGEGRFRIRTSVMLETDGYSLCAADYDQDANLDIYVCGYNARRQDAAHRGLPFPLPYHDANNGGRNYLLRNDGDFAMVDVTSEVGLDIDNQRFSLAASWEDYDNDGDQDLYVANDFGRNCLYQNNGGKFTNVAAAAGVEDHASGMSVSWGDYDRDGWMDLYVSNMFSAAGNRVTFQRRFAAGIADETVANVQRMARGNTLFRNRGDGTFEDTSEIAGVTQGRWAWGSRFVDFNNDGWQDLVVANGYMTNEDSGDL